MGNLPGPVSKLRIIILASLLFSLASQSFVSVQKPASRSRTNVVLLTIDTLRADHLGCYGYKQIQTPNIDKLAAAGARFTTVVAQVPMTFPSHCSILTGTYPMFHKVRDNMGYQLEDSKTTLAEILKPNGYQTGAFVGAYILHSRFGLKQGFDFYYDHFEPWKNSGGITDPTQLEHRGEEVMNQAIQWLGGVSQKAPFFAWVHLYDPHDPYEPPEPFKSQYKSRPYDGEIAYVDQQIGRLVSFLHNKELYEKTLIVLTGDHGESFGEHQEFKHGYFIYDTTLLVPLIIKPVAHAFKSIVIPQQVRLVDIAPSLLQLLELPKGEDMQGTGLLGLLLGKQKDLQLEAYSESFYPAQFGGSALYSLRLPNTKYIDAPRPEFYDLKQDPAELKNQYAQNQALAQQLKNRLAEMSNSLGDKGPEKNPQLTLSSEELEKLGALGYVGGPMRTNPSQSGSHTGPDPKDKLEVFNLMTQAGQNATNKKYALAVQQLQRVIELDPSLPTAYVMLGRNHFRLEQYEPAYRAFLQLLKFTPQNTEANFYVAACEFYLNRLDGAEAGFKKILAQNPNYTEAHKYLGTLYHTRGQSELALQEFQRVLDLAPEDEEAHFRLGFLLARQNKLSEAIRHFQKVIELNPSNAGAHHNLGLVYLRTNQNDLAQKQMAQACKLDPKFCGKN